MLFYLWLHSVQFFRLSQDEMRNAFMEKKKSRWKLSFAIIQE